MSGCSSWRIANYHHPPGQIAKTDHVHLSVVLSVVPDLEGEAGKDNVGVLEVKATLIKRLLAPGGIVASSHELV